MEEVSSGDLARPLTNQVGHQNKTETYKEKKKLNRPENTFQKNPIPTESNLTISMNDAMLALQEGKGVKQPAMSKILSFQVCTSTLLWFS